MADKRRAVVLGGGGPVGVAWELGLAAGLASGGVDLTRADLVVGTSAGSLAGAMLTSGDDPGQLVADIEALFAGGVGGSGADQVPEAALAEFMEMTFAWGSIGDDPDAKAEHTRKIGAFALAADTISEDAFVGAIGSVMAGRPWPAPFACTSVDSATGDFTVWDAAANVPLERAIASSCSVPGVYPPITIGDSRYMDGGARSALNADLAAGYDVAVVVSVTVMELPPGIDDPRIAAYLATQKAEIAALEASGTTVEVIVPDLDFLMVSNFGLSLMDFSTIASSAEVGTRLGKQEAGRIGAAWE
ncbi:MAG: patatin-like phospholipase family protein [Mycobacterium sp.]|nr:MAG: patatin-like phospholipase family protein [Mycobacterium sp.]